VRAQDWDLTLPSGEAKAAIINRSFWATLDAPLLQRTGLRLRKGRRSNKNAWRRMNEGEAYIREPKVKGGGVGGETLPSRKGSFPYSTQ